jgi:hypothetical protein
MMCYVGLVEESVLTIKDSRSPKKEPKKKKKKRSFEGECSCCPDGVKRRAFLPFTHELTSSILRKNT